MNGRLKVAVIMALSAVALGIISIFITITITEKVVESTKQLQSGGIDTETLELYEERWKRYEKILSCYIRHTEIEDITKSVEILKTIYNQDDELFKIECSRIISASEHLKKTELPSLSNIF